MPALKMKTKSSTDCVGGHSLHGCRKSIKSSKGSHSQVKSSPQEARWHTTFQNPQDVYPNKEVSNQNIYGSEANDFQEAVTRDPIQLLIWSSSSSSSSCDPKFIERMGSESAVCPSITGTIFSPILMHNNDKNEHTELPHLVADDSDDGSCSSTDFQTFPASDFYASESISSLSFDGEMGFNDVLTNSEPDYEHVDTDLMFDMSDRCVIMPFLEKTIESSVIQDEASPDEAVMNFDDSCLYLAVHQIKSSDQESGICCQTGDLEEVECFDPQLFIRSLPDLSEAVSSICPALLPKETRKRKSITLVLDLDETLVHSTLEYCEDADFTFPVFFNMKQHIVYVKRRPYLQVFLERVAQMFEIVIFTASQSIYAEQLLDILDPDRKLISQRIYRESCIFSDGTYTKDLTILGVDLSKVAIIDNSPQVFRLQVNNGIPIRSWFDDPSDQALISLLPFLETLVDADDVRPIIAKKFGNKEE